MKVKVLEEDNNYLKLLITDTEPAIVNGLRRTILAEVPTMAIDTVDVYENSSSMWDEYITHRLAMIPLKVDPKMLPIPLTEENQSEYSVTLTLDTEGPKTVYSSDLHSSDPRVRPVSGKIPIVDLLEGQRIRLEAKAIPGKGEQHAKWQAGLASYQMVHEVDTKGCKDKEACVKSCPRKALRLEGKKIVFDKLKCNGCGFCQQYGAKVTPNRNEYIFFVETNGQMSAKTALNLATQILISKAKEMEETLK